jgi:hypothetical protein
MVIEFDGSALCLWASETAETHFISVKHLVLLSLSYKGGGSSVCYCRNTACAWHRTINNSLSNKLLIAPIKVLHFWTLLLKYDLSLGNLRSFDSEILCRLNSC